MSSKRRKRYHRIQDASGHFFGEDLCCTNLLQIGRQDRKVMCGKRYTVQRKAPEPCQSPYTVASVPAPGWNEGSSKWSTDAMERGVAIMALRFAVHELEMEEPSLEGKFTSDRRSKWFRWKEGRRDNFLWIFSPNSSFVTFCGWVGLDPTAVRERVWNKHRHDPDLEEVLWTEAVA